jgi:hypothetical protein
MERDFKGVWIPKEIYLHEELNWTEKILLVEIDSLAKNGECFATNAHFAKHLKISQDRVSKMITKLKRQGLIKVEMRYKEKSKQIDKRIIIPFPIGENTDTPRQKNLDPLGENTDTPIGEKTYTPIGENTEGNNTVINNSSFNNSINNPNKNKKNTVKGFDLEFETLWKRYPNKQKKKQAKQSFLRARKNNVSLETIESGLNDYINYIHAQRIDPQYIKHGSTWFNGECWNDEYNIIHFKQQRKGFLGLLDEQEERGTIIDYPRRDNQDFSVVPNMLPESLQDL